jgi:pimeloyl-ACP methyl ester carboxylesterase
MSIRPMRIEIPDNELEELRKRLRQTRWPSPITGSDWADGTDGEYLRALTAYWANEYDWREREARLNTLNHFLTEIDGCQIHFIHARGQGANPVPLLLLHGWPSSFVQMVKILPLLTAAREDGTPCFDVVVASLPGYPFSHFPTEPGMSFARIADLMTKLMVEELGYPRFAARGSDQGALVQQQIGLKNPERLIGIHRSGITPFLSPLPENLTPAEVAYQKEAATWAQQETLYARLQSSRPETLTPALADSPVGMASWFLEKFQRWGDCDTDLDIHFGRDALLDNLSLHWFTGAGAASIRLYREVMRTLGLTGRVEVPTAIMTLLRDGITLPAPREWAERSYNVQRWTVLERGGHFPEWEIPEEVATDVRQFFATLVG